MGELFCNTRRINGAGRQKTVKKKRDSNKDRNAERRERER